MAEHFLFSGGLASQGALLLALAGLAAACFTDLRSRRIPNRLNVFLAVGLLSLHISAGGVSGLIDAGLAFAICFGLGLLFYLLGALGAGDVKLLGAISLALDASLGDDKAEILLQKHVAHYMQANTCDNLLCFSIQSLFRRDGGL